VKEIGVGVGVRAKAAYRLPTHLHVRRRAQADPDSIQSSVESGETESKASRPILSSADPGESNLLGRQDQQS
jgi:hypothetical protein